MNRDVMFSNPALQNRFDRVVTSDHEVGGFLFVRMEPSAWPNRFRSSDVIKAARNDATWIDWIESFMVVPNEQPDEGKRSKKNSWSCWDFDKAVLIAKSTADALGAWHVHFHTHPGDSSPEPSRNDIAFAAKYCEWWPGYVMFAIVQPSPLRMRLYRMETNVTGRPDAKFELEYGDLLSWRMKRFQQLRQMWKK